MSGKSHVGTRARALYVPPKFKAYTKVSLVVSDTLEYHAGTDDGRTLTLECPWGTQAMAEDILSKISGLEYQPFSAPSALLDPAAELGDGVMVRNTYSGLYSIESAFGSLYVSKIAAPAEEEIDHEFPYVPSSDRKVTRQIKSVRSELSVQADRIAAKVESVGGNASSFGWSLLKDSWSLTANNEQVFVATKDGVSVAGHIEARSGTIGDCSIVGGKLQVPMANVTGVLTVADSSGATLLSAGNNAVSMAGWDVSKQAFTSGSPSDPYFIGLYSMYSNTKRTIGNVESNRWRIIAGQTFGVTSDGVLSAAKVDLTGAIHATSGDIGGWNIQQDALYSDEANVPNVPEITWTTRVKMTPLTLGYRYVDGVTFRTTYWSSVVAAVSSWEETDSSLSDQRYKRDISSTLDSYESFFNQLKPVRYKYINGSSDRFHTGFIAQEVVAALEQAGLTTQDFAGVMLTHPGDVDEQWRLRRDEFVALNTWQIQLLKERVATLERSLSKEVS